MRRTLPQQTDRTERMLVARLVTFAAFMMKVHGIGQKHRASHGKAFRELRARQLPE